MRGSCNIKPRMFKDFNKKVLKEKLANGEEHGLSEKSNRGKPVLLLKWSFK